MPATQPVGTAHQSDKTIRGSRRPRATRCPVPVHVGLEPDRVPERSSMARLRRARSGSNPALETTLEEAQSLDWDRRSSACLVRPGTSGAAAISTRNARPRPCVYESPDHCVHDPAGFVDVQPRFLSTGWNTSGTHSARRSNASRHRPSSHDSSRTSQISSPRDLPRPRAQSNATCAPPRLACADPPRPS